MERGRGQGHSLGGDNALLQAPSSSASNQMVELWVDRVGSRNLEWPICLSVKNYTISLFHSSKDTIFALRVLLTPPIPPLKIVPRTIDIFIKVYKSYLSKYWVFTKWQSDPSDRGRGVATVTILSLVDNSVATVRRVIIDSPRYVV